MLCSISAVNVDAFAVVVVVVDDKIAGRLGERGVKCETGRGGRASEQVLSLFNY